MQGIIKTMYTYFTLLCTPIIHTCIINKYLQIQYDVDAEFKIGTVVHD